MTTTQIRECVVSYKRSAARVPEALLCSNDVAACVRTIFRRERFDCALQERFVVVALDVKGRPVGWHVAAVGGLSQCAVEPAGVFRFALLTGAASLVVAHNHPSGDPSPSAEDVMFTQRLVEGARLLGLRLLDHVIVADGGGHFSFVDAGILGRN